MAIGWLTVLKAIPWTEVVANAPQIARGAQQLWTKLRKPPAPPPAHPDGDVPAGQDARIALLEAALAEARAQREESARLINALAEQNSQLVTRIELLRRRQTVILWIALLSAALACAALLAAR